MSKFAGNNLAEVRGPVGTAGDLLGQIETSLIELNGRLSGIGQRFNGAGPRPIDLPPAVAGAVQPSFLTRLNSVRDRITDALAVVVLLDESL